MPVYKGRRVGTWRVTVWTRTGQLERIVEGSKKDAQRLERQEQALASDRVARRAPTFVDLLDRPVRAVRQSAVGG